ncbi:amidohydrolase family protein [Rhizobium sp. B230/85]|nr:amidohydrolase family protein [Rhizobium sp. B209b/85]QXZ99122.1 amidohydrolase family protein [Rhizobium sp. B230/85]
MGMHPWLAPGNGEVQAIGGLESLRASYLPADYRRDTERHGVIASVHIEALWNATDPLGEARWLETLDKTGSVAARYVAAAPLGTPEAAGVLVQQAAYDRVVGVRGILSHHPDPKKSFVASPDIAYDKAWRADVARLADLGLHLELMMYPYQAKAVADLASTFPDLQIIVNHCGSPIDRDAEGMQRWRAGLDLVASHENTALKISNPGAYDPGWTYQSVEAVVLGCINAFGTERCMFGSDYPVSRLQMTIDEIYWNFKKATSSFSLADQRAFFHDNAMRFYRL